MCEIIKFGFVPMFVGFIFGASNKRKKRKSEISEKLHKLQMTNEVYIEFFCLDCKKFFYLSGSAPANFSVCKYCKSKNVDNNSSKIYDKWKSKKKGK